MDSYDKKTHWTPLQRQKFKLFWEITAVYCENHTEHTNTLCGQNAEFCNIYKSSSYLTGTHYVSATEPNRLMLFRETVAVYCENHTEHTNTLCGHNAEYRRFKTGGTYI
jgi:translation initiation factor IF-1